MIIHFDNVDFSSRTGPNTFAQRLYTSLTELGHTLVNEGQSAEVSLVFIEPSGKPLAKNVVQRLDGIWFKPEEFETKNKRIKNLYQNADHVIWQSLFDKTMSEKWWRSPKNGSVVRNGISSMNEETDPILQKKLEDLKVRHEKIFICSANWHPQKRLSDNLKLYENLKKLYPTSCLIVMGNNANITGKDVYVTGNLSHKHCIQIFRSSDWMIHLAWLDHCPNTVVEALSCNVPVICSEDGGTKEIVGEFGIILREKKKYQFDLANYDDPPSLDLDQLIQLPEKKSLGQHRVLDMSQVSQNYLDIFSSL